MRFHVKVPKAAWSFVSVGLVLFAGGLAGCDTAPNVNTPEVIKQKEERAAAIQQEDAKANAIAKNKGVTVKNIKGGIKAGPAQ
jgi:hypothetical protein